MNFQTTYRTKDPDCTYCGLPIRRQAEVESNGKPFHPHCYAETRSTARQQAIKEKEVASS